MFFRNSLLGIFVQPHFLSFNLSLLAENRVSLSYCISIYGERSLQTVLAKENPWWNFAGKRWMNWRVRVNQTSHNCLRYLKGKLQSRGFMIFWKKKIGKKIIESFCGGATRWIALFHRPILKHPAVEIAVGGGRWCSLPIGIPTSTPRNKPSFISIGIYFSIANLLIESSK